MGRQDDRGLARTRRVAVLVGLAIALTACLPISGRRTTVGHIAARVLTNLEAETDTDRAGPTASSRHATSASDDDCPVRCLSPNGTERGPIDEGAEVHGERRAGPTVSRPGSGPLSRLTSPDDGDHCAPGLDAASLTDFFSQPIGSFRGADYQRTIRLPDDRVLWTFQDAFIDGTLVHNAALIQSGRCFSLLNDGHRSWLLSDETAHMRRWHWILAGGVDREGEVVHLYVAEMREHSSRYLGHTVPERVRRVELDVQTLQVRRVDDEPATGPDLYGWSVTADDRFTYLYSHCYQQFGFDGMFGFGSCAADVKLARVPLGDFDDTREYWTGNGWGTDHQRAAAVVDGTFTMSGNNPAQIAHDGDRFVLVEKRDDWMGRTVEFGVSRGPQGPFEHVASIDEPLKGERDEVNTYFASWVPWRAEDGSYVFGIGHNTWDGEATASRLDVYRPTFHQIRIR